MYNADAGMVICGGQARQRGLTAQSQQLLIAGLYEYNPLAADSLETKTAAGYYAHLQGEENCQHQALLNLYRGDPQVACHLDAQYLGACLVRGRVYHDNQLPLKIACG
jgi:hypothetical protein